MILLWLSALNYFCEILVYSHAPISYTRTPCPYHPRANPTQTHTSHAQITRGVSRIKVGLQRCLYLGNLDAQRDWGHAVTYPIALDPSCHTINPFITLPHLKLTFALVTALSLRSGLGHPNYALTPI